VKRWPKTAVRRCRFGKIDVRFAAVFLCLMLHVPLVVLVAGQEHASTPPASPSGTPGKFVDITARSGINFRYQASHTSKKYLPETMGAGVALFDYDNDGRLDIFLVNGTPLGDPTPKGTIPQKRGHSIGTGSITRRRTVRSKTSRRKQGCRERDMDWA